MSKKAKTQSPLVEIAVEKPLVDLSLISITENPFQFHFVLRGLLSDSVFVEAVKTILSVKLPGQANTVTQSQGISALWMSPDQWLLLSNSEEDRTKMTMLQGWLEDSYASINELSSGQTILSLKGAKAREVLTKGTTLDIHPRVFKPGQCAQTVFAKMNVLIYPRDSKGQVVYDLIVRRSFADFLGRWLINACYEYEKQT